jgi:hypothetical protein
MRPFYTRQSSRGRRYTGPADLFRNRDYAIIFLGEEKEKKDGMVITVLMEMLQLNFSF